jgi:glycosyltransferase involved in cell wall biosynthesis
MSKNTIAEMNVVEHEELALKNIGIQGELGRRPLVTAIIIFFNEEHFLEEAIKSVFAQTYDNWELLLVDDGSTDASPGIAHLYAEQHPKKIKYLEHVGHKNRGMSASRNLGLMNANGKYIAHLDADDVWFPHKIERQVAILEKYPEANLVYGPWQAWYGWNKNEKRKDHLQNLNVLADRLVQPPNLVPIWLKFEHSIPGHCATMVRRKVCQDLGGFDESFQNIFEDLAFLVKLGLNSTIYVSSDCLSRYRQHHNSTCQIYGQKGQLEQAQLVYFEWLEVSLEPFKHQYSQVWSTLKRVLWLHRHPRIRRISMRMQRLIRDLKNTPYHIARRLIPKNDQLNNKNV